jgi:3(or 17)beta-hydroxysteroid dehydrogenase
MSHTPVVLITGGAGGLGLATARRFVATGARTIIADLPRHQPAPDLGPLGRFASLDVTVEGDWKRLEDDIARTDGRLDVLVNCAGVIEAGDIETANLSSFRRIVDTNLIGTFLGCQTAVRLMKSTGGGCIINISSGIAGRAQAEQPAYGASKAAIENLTKSVALHCGRQGYGIRAVAIQPGALDSTMLRGNTPAGMTEEAFLARVVSRFPIGRLGTYDDIAASIVFLASPEASYITGAVIPVDGGQSI